MDSNKSIFISAGEQSGDIHASGLINELKKLNPSISFIGLGGNLSESSGLKLLHHIKELATIGFMDVLKKFSFFKEILKECAQYIQLNNPDVVVLIDYPGFNIRLAEKIRKFYEGKIIYYISPQLWAWHKKRVYKIKENVDKMLVVFPFEVAFYNKYGVDAEYVGHPLVKKIKSFMTEHPKEKKIFGKAKIITFLPGSRKDEIKLHLPVLLEIGNQLKKEFDVIINISKAPSLNDNVFDEFSNQLAGYNLTSENTYKLILNSDLVLTKAGTSTIECGLIGTPFLIFYKTHALNYFLLKPIVTIENLGMVNILAKENIIREYVQKEFTPDNVLLEARRILTDDNYAQSIRNNLSKLWNILGDKDASENAVKIISSYLS